MVSETGQIVRPHVRDESAAQFLAAAEDPHVRDYLAMKASQIVGVLEDYMAMKDDIASSGQEDEMRLPAEQQGAVNESRFPTPPLSNTEF